MSHFNWSSSHLSAYIRPRVSKEPIESEPHHQQNPFSLSWQLQIKIQKIHKNSRTLMNPSSNSTPIQTNSVPKLQIHHWIQLTESNRSKFTQIQHKFEQFLEIRVNLHHWIAVLAIQREHATGGSTLRAWSQALDQRRRRRRRGKGFHRIRTRRREKERKPVLPAKIRSQGSKKRPKTFQQNSGNV